MKKILFILIIIIASISCNSNNKTYQLSQVEYNNYVISKIKLEAYKNYYNSTENWLDELESDYGDLMSGSDANAQYLEDKVKLDKIKNM